MKMHTLRLAVFSAVLVLGAFIVLPFATSADTTSTRLGGGNALLRAQTGMTNANAMSDLLVRLQFASLQGNQGEDVPATPTEGDNSAETEVPVNENANANQNAHAGNGSNGGALGANGGAGGSGSLGGLINAGNVFSNSNAHNAINTVIIRIGR